ncbi:hypothetical protein SAMN05216232_2900 [Virgibacillus subterraneus]|uniref:YtxH domain-containing protein n=1 Tax=Virgibacillus subterraneus TaxID=621109 RepID=A0A1H9HJJ8_9BACI|nr:hypothetical protein [Virgibacillus subterraneus]SEQ62426.1 hypothetical protein SAMN05216232_2900 [Virgibacillus subterraneus]
MRKRYIASAAGAIGAGIMGVILNKEENRNKLKDKVRYITNKVKDTNKSNSTLEDAGIPDQTEDKDPAQLENAKMVSEGSQFGVDYYNEVKEKESEENNMK